MPIDLYALDKFMQKMFGTWEFKKVGYDWKLDKVIAPDGTVMFENGEYTEYAKQLFNG